jgi:hypothetical protein
VQCGDPPEGLVVSHRERPLLLACTDDLVELVAGKMARRYVGRVLNKTGDYTAFNAIWWRCTPRTKRLPPRTHAFKNRLLPHF